MSDLAPLETLFEQSQGSEQPLPPELAALYGRFALPRHGNRPHVMGNFVSTLDGVVALGEAGKSGGGEISGFNKHDRAVMGLLRASADAVVVGAGTLRSVPGHLWTSDYIYPPLAGSYQALRAALGKSGPPLNVIVTERGEVHPDQRVFKGEVPALVVTTPEGGHAARERGISGAVQVAEVDTAGSVSARSVLEAVSRVRPVEVVLVEGGPHWMCDFFAERLLDELFLTLAPQVAGRDSRSQRPGFVSGRTFAPDDSQRGRLVSASRGASHLLLRYLF